MATAMTMLNAVNICLRAVGESPVSSANTEHPYAIAALDILEDKNKDIQSQGWFFNTQRSLKLSPDINGEILIPTNTLAIDSSDLLGSLTVRDNKLVDLYEHTSTFTGPVTLDVVELVAFEQLPYVASKAIAYAAAAEMQRSYEMEAKKLQSYLQEYQFALMELKKTERRNRNSNSTHNAMSQRMMGITQPTGSYNPNTIGGR